MNLLQVKGLKKYFPIHAGLLRRQVGSVKAVDGVNFTLKKGEVLGIVGESGSGKSTVARAAIRLIEPTAGSVLWKGESLLNYNALQMKKVREEIQMVFQDPFASLNPRKKVLESIGEALLYYRRVKTIKEQKERVADLLKKVGLPEDAMNRYPHSFSGGQQQRICIARAIALEPMLLVCDEAVSALDVSVQAQIINLLLDLKESNNLSYIFISHDLSIVRHLADNVMVLYLGKIMEYGPANEIFNNPKHPYTQALLSAIPKSHPSEKKQRIILKGEIPSPSHPPSGCPFRTRCPYAQPICSEPPPHRVVNGNHEYFCILE